MGHILLFCLFSSAVYLLVVRGLTIQTIVVVGNNVNVQVSEDKLPKTLLLFPAQSIRTQLLADNPILADIQFQKKYPHTLVIVPTLRTAMVRLVLTGREVLADESGIVLAEAGASSQVLPRLVLALPAARIGETLNDRRVTAGIAFIAGMRDLYPIHTVSEEDELSLRAKGDKLDIIIPQDGSVPALLATLQTLLSGFRIKGTLPTFIDLRFNKPIIKF